MVSIGLGTGIRAVPKRESLTLPLVLDVRAALMKTKVAPYIGFAVGTGLLLNKKTEIAVAGLAHFEVGVRIKKETRSAIQIGVSYEQMPVYDTQIREAHKLKYTNGVLSGPSIFGLEVTLNF